MRRLRISIIGRTRRLKSIIDLMGLRRLRVLCLCKRKSIKRKNKKRRRVTKKVI